MSYIRQLLIRQALRHKTNRPSGLIGQYKPYLNSNDSPSRDILKDYSGQGHDIQLYNFGYAENSGYGLYKADLNAGKTYNSTSGTDVQILERTSSKLIIKEIKITSRSCIYTHNSTSDGSLSPTNRECPSYKVKISNLPDNTLEYQYISEDGMSKLSFSLKNGINTLPKSYVYAGDETYISHGFYILSTAQIGECNIIIEQIPDYPGALVSDGVDDYGLCENFPILTKEKGYTVCAIRKWISINSENHVFLSNANKWDTGTLGTFNLERIGNKPSYETNTFGGSNGISDVFDIDNLFVFQTSNRYQDKTLTNIGSNPGQNVLTLFCGSKIGAIWKSSIALYALEIYDHDLTDEEIESVKEAMVREYEKETGNVL